jgi:hypothetical protein
MALVALIALVASAASTRLDAQPAPSPASATTLPDLVAEAGRIGVGTRSAAEYAEAARRWHALRDRLGSIDRAALDRDDRVDAELLDAHARTRLFEIETVRLHTVHPVAYLELARTNALFVRNDAVADGGIRLAVAELRQLPAVLANARANLTAPARVWTENAIAQARYARLMLDEDVPRVRPDVPGLRDSLLAAARTARAALDEHARWMETVLLPRSTRPPTWKPAEIDFYHEVQEQLGPIGVDSMLRLAEGEERRLDGEMRELARRIHPSGDVRRVWELMKDEAPPWPEVLPMAQRYVDLTSTWLRGPGAHLVTIPEFDYGARLTAPMARRTLSFGGATYGPTVAGRLSGYYVLTPLEPWLTDAERASRIRSYNPYWTHVISYHEWLGHTAQRASKELNAPRPMRRMYQSAYFSQAWSFYLERLLEEEGYFEAVLPHVEALKTRMARRQMRMWRVQRILTKLRMARGEMTFDQAVRAYVERIGMEPTNAFLEVQRDSQTPASPGREIVGELLIVELREEARRRFGAHYTPRRFHDLLISHGDLPLSTIRRLMFGD